MHNISESMIEQPYAKVVFANEGEMKETEPRTGIDIFERAGSLARLRSPCRTGEHRHAVERRHVGQHAEEESASSDGRAERSRGPIEYGGIIKKECRSHP